MLWHIPQGKEMWVCACVQSFVWVCVYVQRGTREGLAIHTYNHMQMDVSQSDANDFIITKNISTVKIKLQTEVHTLCYLKRPTTLLCSCVYLYSTLNVCNFNGEQTYGFSWNTLLKFPLLFASLFLPIVFLPCSCLHTTHFSVHYSPFTPLSNMI